MVNQCFSSDDHAACGQHLGKKNLQKGKSKCPTCHWTKSIQSINAFNKAAEFSKYIFKCFEGWLTHAHCAKPLKSLNVVPDK